MAAPSLTPSENYRPPEMRQHVDYLAIGNPTLDYDAAGQVTFGGSCLYAGIQAAAFGMTAAVYGRCADAERLRLTELLVEHGVTPMLAAASTTTAFRNVFSGIHRTQRVVERGERIQLPPTVTADVCHLCPVFDEVPLDGGSWAWLRRNRFVCCTPQGAQRRLDAHGDVHLVPLEADPELWSRVDLLVVNEEEEPFTTRPIDFLLRRDGIVAVTLGPGGARVRQGARDFVVPALRIGDVVDQNGAGDCFAAAFSVGLVQGLGLDEATRLAVAASGLSVSGPGIEGVVPADVARRHLSTGGP